jgi:hypothetical protein
MQIAASTQSASALSAPGEVPRQPTACIITLGPGDAAWEEFGHNMLWIRDPSRQVDRAYNWGIFDFGHGVGGAVNFVFNFIQGQLWYWMVGFDTDPEIDFYLQHDRSIWVQELNLSPDQVGMLLDYCQWFEQPRNRSYKYDYFIDNCSTRVRDAVDEKALAGQIKRRASTMPSQISYRSETDRLMADNVVLYTSLNFILGHPTDRKLTAWEEMYIPMRLRERFNRLTITDPATGREIPLVKKEIVLNISKRPALRDTEPNRIGWFLGAGLLVGAGLAAGGRGLSGGSGLQPARDGAAKWGFLLLGVFWSLLAGLAGWILIYFWTLTDHVWVRPNENILQLSPLLLALVLLMPLALLRRRRWPARTALALAVAAFGASTLGLLLKVLPSMGQDNWNMIALALPANAGLAWALWKLESIWTTNLNLDRIPTPDSATGKMRKARRV